ncbi:MAG TPA: hypothetical protein VFZ44_06600 [Pyrinomonadaceae bacterium]
MKYLSGLSTFAFTICLLLLILPGHAKAAVGDLDPTYGSGGAVTTEFPGERAGIGDAAVQPDGKLVVIGVVAPPSGVARTVVARYRLNGSLDPSFGSGDGVAPSPIGAGSVVVQPDGKIILGGGAGGSGFALARLNPDGSRDSTFGSGGLATASFSSSSGLRDLALQPDGKIVAVGEFSFSSFIPLARFNPNGSLDATFGNGGKVTAPMGASARAWAVTIQSDGKIVTAGDVAEDFTVARLNPDGTPDQSFGVGGKVTTDIGGSNDRDVASGVALQPDGKIVAVGYGKGTTFGIPNPVVARYNSDGSRDTTFGVGGTVILDAQGSRATSLVILGDGRIFVAWASFGGDNAPWRDFNLLGLDPAGRIVSMVATDFGNTELPTALVLQPDGKLVAAGVTYGDTTSRFALVRYLTSTTGAPVLQTEAGTNRAVALDSVTLTRGPFTIHTEHNFAPDLHTRVLLFVTLLDPLPGEVAPAVTAQAEVSGGGVFPLTVEHAGKVPGFEWLTQVVVQLPHELEAAGDVQVSVSLRGAASNKAVITIQAAGASQ